MTCDAFKHDWVTTTEYSEFLGYDAEMVQCASCGQYRTEVHDFDLLDDEEYDKFKDDGIEGAPC